MRQVPPTLADPVAANASEVIGGPQGRWAATGRPARALQVVLAAGAATYVLGALRTLPCALTGWQVPFRYEALCYSDIPVLYTLRGIAEGGLPYVSGGTQPLEYPVLTGMFAWFAGLLTPGGSPAAYYWVTAVLLMVCFLLALAATALTVPHRVWDGLLLALAPSVLLAGLINWDWLAVALTSLALLAWSRSRPVLAGALLGLAVAAKFYPVVILGPLALLCWRRRRTAAFVRALAAAAVAWLAVNLPFALAAPDGWATFFRFSSERGQDFGSLWLAMSQLGWQVDPGALNVVAAAVLGLLCLGIAALALGASRPPRLAQLAFLVVAAFVVTNKVYSPQFVLWLLPLAVLARPRWRDILIWQAAEAVYFVAIWWYLVDLTPDYAGLQERGYALAILAHIAGVGYLSAVVVRDILRPAADPVRTDLPYPEEDQPSVAAAWPPLVGGRPRAGDTAFDDPGGGVLDGAPDRMPGRGPAALSEAPTAR